MSKDCAPLFNDSNPLGPHFILKHIKGFSNRVYILHVQKLRGFIDRIKLSGVTDTGLQHSQNVFFTFPKTSLGPMIHWATKIIMYVEVQ